MLQYQTSLMSLIGLWMVTFLLGYAVGASTMCGIYGKPDHFKASLKFMVFGMLMMLFSIYMEAR